MTIAIVIIVDVWRYASGSDIVVIAAVLKESLLNSHYLRGTTSSHWWVLKIWRRLYKLLGCYRVHIIDWIWWLMSWFVYVRGERIALLHHWVLLLVRMPIVGSVLKVVIWWDNLIVILAIDIVHDVAVAVGKILSISPKLAGMMIYSFILQSAFEIYIAGLTSI